MSDNLITFEVRGGDKYKRALDAIRRLNMAVKAGVPENAKTTDGKSIPLYAFYNEMGTRHIPARPFLRNTLADKQNEWLDTLIDALDWKDCTQNQAKNALGLLGEVMKAKIKQTIQAGDFMPDAEATWKAKERKGKKEPAHPLIDTGQLLESIAYEVRKP
jgi:hypothetical protein